MRLKTRWLYRDVSPLRDRWWDVFRLVKVLIQRWTLRKTIKLCMKKKVCLRKLISSLINPWFSFPGLLFGCVLSSSLMSRFECASVTNRNLLGYLNGLIDEPQLNPASLYTRRLQRGHSELQRNSFVPRSHQSDKQIIFLLSYMTLCGSSVFLFIYSFSMLYYAYPLSVFALKMCMWDWLTADQLCLQVQIKEPENTIHSNSFQYV